MATNTINNTISYRSRQSCSILYDNQYKINYETTYYYMYMTTNMINNMISYRSIQSC